MFSDMCNSATQTLPNLGSSLTLAHVKQQDGKNRGVLVRVGACEGNRLDSPSVLAVSSDFPV